MHTCTNMFMHGQAQGSTHTGNTQHPHRQTHPVPPLLLIRREVCWWTPDPWVPSASCWPLAMPNTKGCWFTPFAGIQTSSYCHTQAGPDQMLPQFLAFMLLGSPVSKPQACVCLVAGPQASYPSCCWSGLKFTCELCILILTYTRRGLKLPRETHFSTCWCSDLPYKNTCKTEIPSSQSALNYST